MSTNFTDIETLKFWCQKVLPLVYDDSLSYYELLGKVVAKLNEVIKNVDNIPDYLRELITEEKLTPILSLLLDELRTQIAPANEHDSSTATVNRSAGELVWLKDKLYRVTRTMLAGDQYVLNSNIEKVNVELLLSRINNDISSLTTNLNNEITARSTGDSDLQIAINNEKTDRVNADTSLQNAINTEKDVRQLNDENLHEGLLSEHRYIQDIYDKLNSTLDVKNVNASGSYKGTNVLNSVPSEGYLNKIENTVNYTGGSRGSVVSPLAVINNNNSENSNFQWSILGILNDRGGNGENCAGYFQANRYLDGTDDWALAVESVDRIGTISDDSGAVRGIEIAVRGNGGGTKSLMNRIGLHIVSGTTGVPGATGYNVHAGIAIGVDAGNESNGYYYGIYMQQCYAERIIGGNNNFRCSIGIDFSEFSCENAAIKLGEGQIIDFADKVTLTGYSTALQMKFENDILMSFEHANTRTYIPFVVYASNKSDFYAFDGTVDTANHRIGFSVNGTRAWINYS